QRAVVLLSGADRGSVGPAPEQQGQGAAPRGVAACGLARPLTDEARTAEPAGPGRDRPRLAAVVMNPDRCLCPARVSGERRRDRRDRLDRAGPVLRLDPPHWAVVLCPVRPEGPKPRDGRDHLVGPGADARLLDVVSGDGRVVPPADQLRCPMSRRMSVALVLGCSTFLLSGCGSKAETRRAPAAPLGADVTLYVAGMTQRLGLT